MSKQFMVGGIPGGKRPEYEKLWTALRMTVSKKKRNDRKNLASVYSNAS